MDEFPDKLFIFIAHEENGKPYPAVARHVRKLAEVKIRVRVSRQPHDPLCHRGGRRRGVCDMAGGCGQILRSNNRQGDQPIKTRYYGNSYGTTAEVAA